jgi:putative MATE family efflux protein
MPRPIDDLTTGSVSRHLLHLTIPMFLGISSMMLASMVDTIYIGWIGTRELAAVSFSFPVVMGLSSVSMGLGIGATSSMARTLGRGDRAGSLLVGTHTLVLVAMLVLVLAALGLLTRTSFFAWLGADADTLPLVDAYMCIWLIGLPLFALPMVAMSMLRALGDARTSGTLMVAGALLQVVIAPVLIFGVPHVFDGIGFLGSAWAFVISRGITFVLTAFVLAERGLLRPPGKFATMLASWREVLRIGVPSTLSQMIGPVSMAVVIGLLAPHGHAVVAGFGVAQRIESLALMVLMALGSSISPFVGQNWGAGRHGRIREALLVGYRFSIVWGVVASALLFVFGRPIVAAINDHPDVIEATYAYLVIVPLSYTVLGASFVAGSAFVALGKPMPSLVLTLCRMVVVYLPLAIVGNRLFGYEGIYWAGAFANVLAGAVAVVWVGRLVPSADASIGRVDLADA